MSKAKRTFAGLLAVAAVGTSVVPAAAWAQVGEGPGNGAGQSKQCTGPQADRPASCTSQGGPGDQGSN
jgi:hypothetical protein